MVSNQTLYYLLKKKKKTSVFKKFSTCPSETPQKNKTKQCTVSLNYDFFELFCNLFSCQNAICDSYGKKSLDMPWLQLICISITFC